jgi:uncharacterized protein YecT (DUF1311 family)
MRASATTILVGAALLAGGARAEYPECGERVPDVATPGIDGATCDSLALYYGIGRPRDLAAARLCAYAERADPSEFGLGGPGVLMMMHANGDGVPRDIALAKKFACEMGGSEFEMKFRAEHIDAMAADPATAGRIEACDDISSGLMQGTCALLYARMDEELRKARYSTLSREWTPAQVAALTALRQAATDYFESSAGGELDQSGSGHVATYSERVEELEMELVTALERLEQGRLPGGGRHAAQQSDAELNEAYASKIERLRTGEEAADRSDCFGTVKADDVREAQRAWLKYRDAFVAFGRARYPSVNADAWVDRLSRERLYELTRVDMPCDVAD